MIPKVTVIIEDGDTDQDWFPDAWEYQMNPGEDFLEPIGPSSTWPEDMGNTEVNPTLTTGAWPAGTITLLAFGSTDSDGDGIDDAREMILGTDAGTSDAGAVYNNLLMGLAPADTLELAVKGLSITESGPEIEWNVAIDKSDSGLSQGMLDLLSASGDGTVRYYVDYTPSLENPEWMTVEEGTVTLDGSMTLINRVSAATVDPARGFFRVRLGY